MYVIFFNSDDNLKVAQDVNYDETRGNPEFPEISLEILIGPINNNAMVP